MNPYRTYCTWTYPVIGGKITPMRMEHACLLQPLPSTAAVIEAIPEAEYVIIGTDDAYDLDDFVHISLHE